MEKQERQGGPIRLTNKTALALRRGARQARTMALVQAAAITAVLAVAAVLLGIRWLPAVPILTAVIVLADASLYVSGRTKYLSLTGQAICAEAAARALREQSADQKRREKAKRDLDTAKEDVRRAVKEAEASRETGKNEQRESGQTEEKKPERRSQILSDETRPITRSELERLRTARDAEKEMNDAEERETDADGAPDEEEADEVPTPARRRRRQAALTVLRAEDVK